MAAILVVLWLSASSAQSPTATPIRPGDPNEITVELPKMGSPVVEAADEADPVAVIASGQEELLAQIVGRGVTLAGGCTLSGGQIDGPALVATYACPGGPVIVELVHPDQGPSGSTKTERFAIALKSGTAPEGLLTDLVQRVRAHEATFEWKWLGTPRPKRSSLARVVIAIAGVAVVAALGLAMRARRSR